MSATMSATTRASANFKVSTRRPSSKRSAAASNCTTQKGLRKCSFRDDDGISKTSHHLLEKKALATTKTTKTRKAHFVPKASSSSAVTSPSAKSASSEFVWKGANLKAAAMSVGFGLFVCFVVPRPDGVVPQAWNLLSIFLATVAGLVLSPLPVGAWAFLGLTTAVAVSYTHLTLPTKA